MTAKRLTVLIAGASGLVGAAAVDAFLDDGWDVVAVSRRPPEVCSGRTFRHIPVDLRDHDACRQAFAAMPEVTHLLYAAVYEKPGLIEGWRAQDQMDVNLVMLRNLMEPLTRAADLEHVTLLQGTKAYGVHRHPIRIPARERHPRDPHPNFYWLHEDYLLEMAATRNFGWTILRPQMIVGPNYGVAMNLPPVIGAYAAICREQGRPFGFPGGAPYVTEAVDARLVARAARWAATSPQAWEERYNLTNGEVFEWRDLWPAIADELGLEAGPDEPVRLAELLPAKADVWDRLVRRHGLRPLTMSQLLGESHHYADYCFAAGALSAPSPAFVSTIKIKRAGFCDTQDSEESMRHWLRVLIKRRVLPSLR